MTFRAFESPIGRMRMLAGDAALDFANTLHWRNDRQVDFIPDYRTLIDWAVPAGFLQEAEAERLKSRAVRNPGGALSAHADALVLRRQWREHLTQTVGPDSGRTLPGTAAPLAQSLAGLLANSALALGLGDLQEQETRSALLLPVVRIALSIASLQLIPAGRTLGRCEGDPCGGFFLNTSRSRPRRWCSMDSCGNRAKVRHFRSRFAAESAE